MIFCSQIVPRNRTIAYIYSFSPDIGFRAQFWFTTRFTNLRSRPFSIFYTFVHWNFSKYFFKTFCSKVGSTEIWTRVFGFKVQGANHYTIEPITLFFEIEIGTNVCWLHDSFWKELFGKKWYFSPKWCQ